MKILFISSNKNLLDYANLFFLNDTKTISLESCLSVSSAIATLSLREDFDLIYLGHQLQKDEKLSELSNHLIPLINKGKVIFIGTNKAFKNRDWAKYYNELHPPQKILFEIYNMLGLKKTNEYIQVQLNSLMKFTNYPFNCFHQVQKGESTSFLKIFNQADDITFDDINKYISKGLQTFYIKTSEVELVLENYESHLQAQVELADVDSIKELAMEYALELLDESGLNIKNEHKVISKKAFEHTQELIESSKKNKEKFLELINKTDTFYYKHITMTSLISCFILDELMLTDPILKEKLCLASNFQNLFLENELELQISERVELTRLDRKDQKRILAHAHLASTLLEKNDRIDLDVLKIVKEHHGDNTGQSFPAAISSTSKLSLIFQLANTFAQKYLIAQKAYGQKVDVVKILNAVIDKLEIRDKSLVKSLKEVALNISNT